jgi:hypothetical protein
MGLDTDTEAEYGFCDGSVTFSTALHFSKLGLLTNHIAAIKDVMHNTSNADLIPN